MAYDDVITRNDDGELAVRTVSVSEGNAPANYDDVMTRDENGNLAVRVIGNGGGGSGDQHNLGYYATQAALEEAHPTAEAGDWAIVGSTDTVWVWDSDNTRWVDSDQKGQVTSVNGQTGDVVLDLLPTQTGNAGKFLTTDGTDASWGTELTDALVIRRSGVTDMCLTLYNGTFYGSIRMDLSTSSFQFSRGLRVGGNLLPTFSGYELGSSSLKWILYATKINNGSDITVPTTGGTMVVADYTGASQGDVLTLDSTGNAVWQAGGGGGLPTQTGNAGKFLTTDGTDASWSDKPLVNQGVSSEALMIAPSQFTTTVTGNSTFLNTGIYNSSAFSVEGAVSIGGYYMYGLKPGDYTVGINGRPYSQHSIAINGNVDSGSQYGIGIGGTVLSNAQYAIQLGYGSNSNANTFKVANANGNFEIMSADGTVPTARLTKVNTTATLAVADWSSNTQTVSVGGVKADSIVFVSPAPASASDYASAGILCTGQGTDSLTFTCTTTPSNAITVNVVCM